MLGFLKRFTSATTHSIAGKDQAQKSANNHKAGRGPDKIFVDAIYEHPTNQDFCHRPRPFRSKPSALEKLARIIAKKLEPVGPQQADHNWNTGFDAIRCTPEGRFKIRLENNLTVDRSEEEAELHVLLQSQVRYASSLRDRARKPRNRGDVIDIAEIGQPKRPQNATHPVISLSADATAARANSPAVATQPVAIHAAPPSSIPSFRPSATAGAAAPAAPIVALARTPAAATSVEDLHSAASTVSSTPLPDALPPEGAPDPAFNATWMTDDNGNHLYTFKSDTVDMSDVGQMLMQTSHMVKKISGANGNCWLRSGWLYALSEHISDSTKLEQILCNKLGPAFYDDAARIGAMAQAYNTVGVQEIVTNMELANRQRDFETDSYLKMPGSNYDLDGHEGEAVCMRLTHALLKKAGFSENELDFYINQSNFGEQRHYATLLRDLECDLFIYARYNAWDDATLTQRFVPEQSCVTLSPQPGSGFYALAPGENQSCHNALVNETDGKPALITNGNHIDVCIPKSNFIGGSCFQWPT